MPRTVRHEYPGAVFHVKVRGDGGKAIFESDDEIPIPGYYPDTLNWLESLT